MEHPDNTGSLSLQDFKIQISRTDKFILVSVENQPLKTSLSISNQHFYPVPKQITLEMKINEFTIDSAKKKTKIHTPHTL